MVESVELKFGYVPARTARQSYYEDRIGATIRFEDEKEIDESTRLKMIRSDTENLIGYANVRDIQQVPVWNALDIIKRNGALYGIEYTDELIETLGKYYSRGMGPETIVKIIFYQTYQVVTS